MGARGSDPLINIFCHFFWNGETPCVLCLATERERNFLSYNKTTFGLSQRCLTVINQIQIHETCTQIRPTITKLLAKDRDSGRQFYSMHDM